MYKNEAENTTANVSVLASEKTSKKCPSPSFELRGDISDGASWINPFLVSFNSDGTDFGKSKATKTTNTTSMHANTRKQMKKFVIVNNAPPTIGPIIVATPMEIS